MRACFVIIFTLTLALTAKEPDHDQRVIDLKAIGYPQPPCDYMFPEDGFAKNSIEFLDSERLLVSFSTDMTRCNENHTYTPSTFRSVIIDSSGKILRSFDWQHHQDIQAGPNGHILFTTGKEIRILDSDFSLLQTIPDPRPEVQRTGVDVDPARHGFVVNDGYPTYHVVYFSGTPAQKTLEADHCNAIAVEGGFVCWESDHPSRFTAHVEPNAPQPDLRGRNTVFTPGLDRNPDKKWVAPGWPAWLGQDGRSISSTSGRIMYFCRGTRFPLTDGNGLGNFLRVIVVDTKENRTPLRKQYDVSSDVALSPDGNWFAVREGTRLTLRRL
jgi:hypothetical protein